MKNDRFIEEAGLEFREKLYQDGFYLDRTRYVAASKTRGLTLLGDATVWDDVRIAAQSVKLGASEPDWINNPAFGGNSNLYYYAFDGVNTLEQVFFSVQLPHSYKPGSTIYPHVHFAPTSTNTADTNEKQVRFVFEYSWANINDAFGAGGTVELTKSFVPNDSEWKHMIAGMGNGIVGSGMEMSSMMLCRLYRDPTNDGDTYPQDVAFLEFDIHIEIDTIGSAERYAK